ncbi:hypothetical protein [Ulvibacter litoralis]|uniref:DUF2383 domain-containing protein n=1 Tax=Ulvibacter litoralis TaxID=227084 RepID=A0A1G7GT96_9FLAO|nr:hypothetical protein [Ulvibacter litoralis]GHC55155.1 hypothetical protein GCM10008083_19070 [Ulvibacter litoralis]SDE91370.1 hypothetical protein SAMN05421855_103317 [Ulvibacter litoralis]
MKKYHDFEKLNRLLVASFEAEKLYYNAALEAKKTEMKRFLNYMSVERNRMSHDISNELHSRDIEPLKEDVEKVNLDHSKTDPQPVAFSVAIAQCLSRDKNNVKRYDELLERKDLPDSILTMLERQRTKITQYITEVEKLVQ